MKEKMLHLARLTKAFATYDDLARLLRLLRVQ